MNRTEHLLIILSEECNEVGHRVSKALRFGLDDVQKDQNFNNKQRLSDEVGDLIGVLEMLSSINALDKDRIEEAMEKKHERVERYLKLSEKKGTYKPEK